MPTVTPCCAQTLFPGLVAAGVWIVPVIAESLIWPRNCDAFHLYAETLFAAEVRAWTITLSVERLESRTSYTIERFAGRIVPPGMLA